VIELDPALSREDDARRLAHARSVKRRLELWLDRILGSGPVLDPTQLAELRRFLDEEACPAARAYADLLHLRHPTSPFPPVGGGGA
jgi:hypothetical protein